MKSNNIKGEAMNITNRITDIKTRLMAILAILLALIMCMSSVVISFAAAAQTDADAGIVSEEQADDEGDVNSVADDVDVVADSEKDKKEIAIEETESGKDAEGEADTNASAFDKTEKVDGVSVRVTAAEGVFPEGSKLSVKTVTDDDELEKVESVVEDERPDKIKVARSYTFDIKVLDANGSEIQPAEGSEVNVSFTSDEIDNDNLDTRVYHVTETASKNKDKKLDAQALEVTTKDDTATVKTDGFSYYTVEFTYGDKTYVMEGDTEVTLADIMDYMGISGDVTKVETSNAELFSAYQDADGEWKVAAHQAFDTDEWMKLTIEEITYDVNMGYVNKETEYDLDVTDSSASDPNNFGAWAAGQDIANYTIDIRNKQYRFFNHNTGNFIAREASNPLGNGLCSVAGLRGDGNTGAVPNVPKGTGATSVAMTGGPIRVRYFNAATDPEGNTCDVIIEYSNVVLFPRADSDVSGKLATNMNLFYGFSDGLPAVSTNTCVNLVDACGVTLDAKVYVAEHVDTSNVWRDNAVSDGSFIFTMYDINVDRAAASQVAKSYDSANHMYFSESVEIPGTYASVSGSSSTSGGTTGRYRNAGQGKEGSEIAQTTGVNGTTASIWTSRTTANTPMYFFPDGITHNTTSDSGPNGDIEVWSSGQIDSGTALRAQYGGGIGQDESKVLTFDVPDGKEVEYKLVPDDGYVIKTIEVDKGDGSGTQIVLPTTAFFKSDGKPDYYTYKFTSNAATEDQTIHVEWQKAKEITVTKEWEGDDDWKADTRPSDVTVQLFGNGEKFEGQSNTPHVAGVSKAIAYDEEQNSITATYNDPEQKLNDGNSWSYTYKYLPEVDMYGNAISYSIKELDGSTAIDNNGKLNNSPYRYTVTYDPNAASTSNTSFKVKNTLDTEQLKVKKTTAGPMEQGETFDFTATLGDTPGSTGKATGLKNGDTETFEFTVGSKTGIKDIPLGMQYTVTEDDNKRYTETKTNDTGSIPEGGVTAEFTNTAPTTELTITKTWDDAEYFTSPATDSDVTNNYNRDAQTLTYTIKAEAGGQDVSSLIPSGKDTMTLTSNNKDASDSSKWTDTLTGLPVLAAGGTQITYTIIETTLAGWKVTTNPVTATPTAKSSASASGDTYEATADFTNTPAKEEDITSIDLTIKKIDKNTKNGLAGATFDITDAAGTKVTTGATAADGTVTYTFTIDGTYTITENTAPAGYEKITASYKVKVNKKLTKIELVDGGDSSSLNKVWKWFYDLLFGTDSGDMPADYDSSSNTLTIKNEPLKAKIEVTKTWDDNDNEFGKRASTSVAVERSTDGSSWSAVTGGAATVETSYTSKTTVLTLTDLPAYEDSKKIEYRVTEGAVSGYDTTYAVNGGAESTSAPTFELVQSGDDNKSEDKTVDITNKLPIYTLTVKNTVTGNLADKSKAFNYKVTIDGVAQTFTLKDGESKTISIPRGASYSVEETDADTAGYTTTASGTASGTVSGNITLSYANDRSGAGVKGDPPVKTIKKVTGDTPDAVETFTFRMTPTDASYPLPSENLGDGVTVKDGYVDIKLPADKEVEIGDIIFNEVGTYTYTVIEEDETAKGYTYDTARFTVTYTVTLVEDANGAHLECVREIKKNDGTLVTECTFSNKFTKSSSPVVPDDPDDPDGPDDREITVHKVTNVIRKTVETGDYNNLIALSLLLMAATGTLGTIVYRRRRSR